MQGQKPAECYITISALGCDVCRICCVSYKVAKCVLDTYSFEQCLFPTLVPGTCKGKECRHKVCKKCHAGLTVSYKKK